MKRSPLDRVLSTASAYVARQVDRPALSSVAHVLVLFGLVIALRPMFAIPIGGEHYEAPVIVRSLIEHDISVLKAAAQRNRPVVPYLLFLVIPTIFMAFTKRRMRWTDWEHGLALRNLVMGVLAIIVYAGATFDYNVLLHRGHPWDRLLLVGLFALSWRTPLAVPFAARWGFILIREPYYPITQDDFEFRAVTDVLFVFSIFVWASARRTFQPWHFLVVGMGAWVSYYFTAGVAKWNYAQNLAWLWENHLTNLSISSHVRGWLGFVDDDVFLAVATFIRPYDRVLAIFTMIVELGALAAVFLHPKLARLWFALLFILQLGIFAMTGICFWKWMLVNAVFFLWLGKGGAPIIQRMCRDKLVVALAVLSVYYSDNKVWYWPQKGVVWFDTQLIDQYDIYAVGASGQKYLVDPNYFAPSDMHFVQGRLCYASDGERGLTGIYGVTGSYSTMKALNQFESPKQALDLHNRGRKCNDPKMRPMFVDFMKRFFGNVNRYGRPYDWFSSLGRPHHLWVHSQGVLFDEQEKVVRVELWHRPVYEHGGKYHELGNKLATTVEIPP